MHEDKREKNTQENRQFSLIIKYIHLTQHLHILSSNFLFALI